MNVHENNGMHNIIREFHNQKEPDFNPQNGILYGGREKGNHSRNAYNGSIAKEKTIGDPSELENIITMSVLILKNVDLKQESAGDEKQIELLDKRKSFALNKIHNLLNDVNYYIISINALDTIKSQKDEMDQKDYIDQFGRADEYRRRMHDSLIQSVQSTIKFIQYNFGKISEKALEKWEEEQEEKGRLLLDVQRVTFPPKVVCPENLDLNDRKQITSWAVQLALSLGQLKNRLSQNHESL